MRSFLQWMALVAAVSVVAPSSARGQHAGGSYQKAIAAADADAFWKLGLFDEAEHAAMARIESGNDDGAAHHVLSRALASRGDFAAGRTEIDLALARDGARADWNYSGGAVYTALRLFDDAATMWARYLKAAASAGEPDVRIAWAAAEAELLREGHPRAGLPLRPPADPKPIRFEIVEGHIYVPVEINGRSAKAMIDTGAERTVLTEETANLSNVPVAVVSRGRRTYRVARIRGVSLGGWTVADVPAMVKTAKSRAAPVYGGDAISPLAFGLSMRIDYERRELTLARELPVEPADITLPLRFVGLPVVRGTVESQPMSFVVDTGAQGTAVAQSVVDRAGRAPGWRAVASTLFNGSGARDYTSMVIVPGLAIDAGPWQLPRRPTVTMDLSTPSSLLGFELGGLIGHNDLRRYVVTFDLIRNALRLAANE